MSPPPTDPGGTPPPDRPFLLTKIIATLGPASADMPTMARLIRDGVRVFRINFSHGAFDDYARFLHSVRTAAEAAELPIAVLGDLSGPKIRIGKVQPPGIELAPGDRVEFQRPPLLATDPQHPGVSTPDTPSAKPGASAPDSVHPTPPASPTPTPLLSPRGAPRPPVVFSTTFPDMIDQTLPGHRVLLDDGAVRLLAVDHLGPPGTHDRRLLCQVIHGGLLTSSKGVNLPDTDLSVPSITEHDWRCVDWSLEHGIDYLALSFVRRAADVAALRDRLHAAARQLKRPAIPVVAKIEKPQAIDDLEAIVTAADAIMVARGDLGVEMDLAEVPSIQKRIVALAHDHGKPVVVATQMLQSMIDSPTPTRAEVSDVANAIYDGADAVMLSGETAVGKHPVQAVNMMARIARVTLDDLARDPARLGQPPRRLQESRYRTAALAHGVSTVVRDLDARLVVTWSELGGGARYLSQNRLHVPIVAASSNPVALRQMALLFGVIPHPMPRPTTTTEFIHDIDAWVQRQGLARSGDPIVLALGEPLGIPGVMNMIRIHYLGDVTRITWTAKPPTEPES